MKNKKKIKWMVALALLTLLMIAGRVTLGREINLELGSSQAKTEFSGVILVPVEYREERWFLSKAGVNILPCDPPTPVVMGEATGPVVRLLGQKGEILFTLKLPMDPRILLYEGTSETSNILDEVSIVLKLPLVEGATVLEYYLESNEDGSVEKKEPVLEIDLQDAIAEYEERGGSEQIAVCQEPEYQPDALGKRE